MATKPLLIISIISNPAAAAGNHEGTLRAGTTADEAANFTKTEILPSYTTY